jgi:tetratricopeptide (TPR) repeat protein
MAGSATAEARVQSGALARGSRVRRVAVGVIGGLALLAAVVVLAFPYLSVREVSIGNDLTATNPSAALTAFDRAAKLNPLNADPGRFGGATALRAGSYQQAQRRFEQAIAREPGGWFPWLGAGLAASALGQRAVAKHDFKVAASIDSQQPAVTTALARVQGSHPLTPQAALDMLVIVQ